MKDKTVSLVIFILLFLGAMALAQSEITRQIPEGMEEVQIGGSGKLIVPKGAHTRKVGAQIIVEGTKEYTSRRFFEMDEEFARIEKRQTELGDELKTLESAVKKIQDDANLNKTNENAANSVK